MIDEEKSKKKAFQDLSKIENVRILTLEEKKKNGFDLEVEVWEVDTEILVSNKLTSIILHITFPDHFPIYFPQIFLSPETFYRTPYIPHVDRNRFICTFDSEIASTNTTEPAGVVIECIRRAKKIIHDGLIGVNKKDFEEEFTAYWEEKYGKEKFFPRNILSLINKLHQDSKVKLICLDNTIQNYKYIIHISDNLSVRFKEFLDDYKFKYHEVDVFRIKNFNKIIPPFLLKNKDVVDIIKDSGSVNVIKYESFINRKQVPKLVICNKHFSNRDYIFGWFHGEFKINVNGFRPGAFKPYNALLSTQSNELVERVSTDVFTPERLENRTTGFVNEEINRCFLIAGNGSIGSNLIYFLNSMNNPEFRFVDNELLKIENISRHLLGFEYIRMNKAIALKDYIRKNNPLQKVCAIDSSIIEVINRHPEFLNEADFIFITIGVFNIENWICQAVLENIIIKPIFLIWVEPYLCGGHCIFLHPSNPNYDKYFENGYFKFNVIDSVEYINGNDRLSYRESGCQTTYIPYSGLSIVEFISSIFPTISSIIKFNNTNTTSYSWLGNVDILYKMKIKTSSYYDEFTKGTLIKHSL